MWRTSAAQLGAQAGVKAGEGFVHQDEFRFRGQGAGQGDALLLAAGELVGVAVIVSRQPYQVKGVGHGCLALRAFAPGAFAPGDSGAGGFGQAEGDIFRYRQVGEQGAVLEYHTHAALFGALVDAVAIDGAPADADAAGVGGVKAGDETQGGGFAATAGAEEAQDFAAPQFQADAGYGGHSAEGFGQAGQVEGAVIRYRRATVRLRRVFRWDIPHFQPALALALNAY